MTRPAKDEEREERINMEIIVDAYGPEEQAMGWYNYLSDTLQFPVPLMQLEGLQVDEETQQAIGDWHYWVNRGYKL